MRVGGGGYQGGEGVVVLVIIFLSDNRSPDLGRTKRYGWVQNICAYDLLGRMTRCRGVSASKARWQCTHRGSEVHRNVTCWHLV